MVDNIDPHIIGITESWATTDISDAELGMTGYVILGKINWEEGEAELFYLLKNPSKLMK